MIGFEWHETIRSVDKIGASSVAARQHQPSEKFMKKVTTKSSKFQDDDMRSEYDFRGAARGKAYLPLHKGYSVTIHKEDGSTVVERYKLIDGAIMLQPDVRAYFPDSDAVNKALRSLINLMSQIPDKSSAKKARRSSRKRRVVAQ
jgi:hypothetical protein